MGAILINPRIEEAKNYTLRGSEAIKRAAKHEKDGTTWAHEGIRHGILRFDIGNTHVTDEIAVPHSVKSAIRDAVDNERISYTDSAGMPQLRKAIADYHGVNPNQVFCVNGVTEAVAFAAVFFANAGANIVLTEPVYPPWAGILLLHGIEVRRSMRSESPPYQPVIESIKSKLDEKTAGVVLISADNPTGIFLDAKTFEVVVKLLADHMKNTGTVVFPIVDDIYRDYIPADKMVKYFRICADAGLPLMYMGGIDKSLGTGLHGGYIILDVPSGLEMHSEMIFGGFNTIFAEYLGANTLTQYASLPYFERYEYVRNELRPNFEKFSGWSESFKKAVAASKNLTYVYGPPEFQLYQFIKRRGRPIPSSDKFLVELVENEGICMCPGLPFGFEGAMRASMVRDPVNPINVVRVADGLAGSPRF